MSISLSLGEFTRTFYKQLGLFEYINQNTGTVDPQLDKILITDDSAWMDRESRLTGTSGVLGVFIPYNRYSSLVPYMENVSNKVMVYSDIAYSSNQMQDSALYNLTKSLRDIGPYSFTATDATYNIQTTPGAPVPSGDVALFSRVPGLQGNAINVYVSGAGAGAVTTITTSGVTIICTYDETAVTAEEVADKINATITAGFVKATFSGAGAGVFDPNGVSGTVINLYTSGTGGTMVGSRKYSKIFSPNVATNLDNGIVWRAATAGPTGDGTFVNIKNSAAGTAESVSATGYLVTVILGTDGLGAVTSTNSSIVHWANLSASTAVVATQQGATGVISNYGVFKLGGGSNRPAEMAFKALYIYKTTNDTNPSYVIVGVEQALQLGLISYLEPSA